MRDSAAEENVVQVLVFLPPCFPLVLTELLRHLLVGSPFELPTGHKQTKVRHPDRHHEPEF